MGSSPSASAGPRSRSSWSPAEVLDVLLTHCNRAFNDRERRNQMRLDGNARRSSLQFQKAFMMFVATGNLAVAAMAVLQGDEALRNLEKVGVRIAESAEASIGLDAPAKFGRQVREYIQYEANHRFYFLFHPDTDWHGHFSHLNEAEGPLPCNFLGVSEHLPSLFAWMGFLRTKLRVMGDKLARKVRFHLLIPTYRPLVLQKEWKPDRNLLPLTIHGYIHGGSESVWLNIVDTQTLREGQLKLDGVGNLATLPPPPSIMDHIKEAVTTFFNGPEVKPAVVYGAPDDGDDDDDDDPRGSSAPGAGRGRGSRSSRRFDVRPSTRHVTDNRRHRRRRSHRHSSH